jgi:hypothetical protein
MAEEALPLPGGTLSHTLRKEKKGAVEKRLRKG